MCCRPYYGPENQDLLAAYKISFTTSNLWETSIFSEMHFSALVRHFLKNAFAISKTEIYFSLNFENRNIILL